MFGNLLNNSLIEQLVAERVINFIPKFERKKLQIAQYPLHPLLVKEPLSPKKTKLLHDFKEDGEHYKIQGNAYVFIDILEQIQLPEGIVGRFIPSSTLIEKGLGIIAGKLEHPFCHDGERIRFGIKNYLPDSVEIRGDERIAYIEFFDLRGMENLEYKLNKTDSRVYNGRRHDPDADGPNYERDNRSAKS